MATFVDTSINGELPKIVLHLGHSSGISSAVKTHCLQTCQTIYEGVLKYCESHDSHNISGPESAEYDILSKKLKEQLKTYTWRGRGVLSVVVHQGMAPTSWLHTVVGFLQAMLCIERKETLQLSEQQLLDSCQTDEAEAYFYPPRMALSWIGGNGITTAHEYSWVGIKGILKESKPLFVLHGVKVVPLDDEHGMENKLREHPLCATIRYVSQLPGLKKGSIYQVKKIVYDHFVNKLGCEVMSHVVLLTGWTVIDGKPVWEAQNTFGDKFCDAGFFYFPKGSAVEDDEYTPLIEVLDVESFKKLGH